MSQKQRQEKPNSGLVGCLIFVFCILLQTYRYFECDGEIPDRKSSNDYPLDSDSYSNSDSDEDEYDCMIFPKFISENFIKLYCDLFNLSTSMTRIKCIKFYKDVSNFIKFYTV